jgi:hypothetical protein
MKRTFEAAVSALCYTVLDERCPPPTPGAFSHNDVVRFVLEQHARMPDYLRLPMRLLTVGFDWWGLVPLGRRFHRAPPDLRRRQVEAWRRSRLGLCRDLIRFYESLAVFGWNSNRHDRQRLQTVPARPGRRAVAG